jgi:hypothetical protein
MFVVGFGVSIGAVSLGSLTFDGFWAAVGSLQGLTFDGQGNRRKLRDGRQSLSARLTSDSCTWPVSVASRRKLKISDEFGPTRKLPTAITFDGLAVTSDGLPVESSLFSCSACI